MLLQYLPKFAAKKEIYVEAALCEIRLDEGILGSPDYSPWVQEFFGRIARWKLTKRPTPGQITLRTLS